MVLIRNRKGGSRRRWIKGVDTEDAVANLAYIFTQCFAQELRRAWRARAGEAKATSMLAQGAAMSGGRAENSM